MHCILSDSDSLLIKKGCKQVIRKKTILELSEDIDSMQKLPGLLSNVPTIPPHAGQQVYRATGLSRSGTIDMFTKSIHSSNERKCS